MKKKLLSILLSVFVITTAFITNVVADGETTPTVITSGYIGKTSNGNTAYYKTDAEIKDIVCNFIKTDFYHSSRLSSFSLNTNSTSDEIANNYDEYLNLFNKYKDGLIGGGTDVKWTLYSNLDLIIEGIGGVREMEDYTKYQMIAHTGSPFALPFEWAADNAYYRNPYGLSELRNYLNNNNYSCLYNILYNGLNVKFINISHVGNRFFYESDLYFNTIDFGENLEDIGESAFYDSGANIIYLKSLDKNKQINSGVLGFGAESSHQPNIKYIDMSDSVAALINPDDGKIAETITMYGGTDHEQEIEMVIYDSNTFEIDNKTYGGLFLGGYFPSYKTSGSADSAYGFGANNKEYSLNFGLPEFFNGKEATVTLGTWSYEGNRDAKYTTMPEIAFDLDANNKVKFESNRSTKTKYKISFPKNLEVGRYTIKNTFNFKLDDNRTTNVPFTFTLVINPIGIPMQGDPLETTYDGTNTRTNIDLPSNTAINKNLVLESDRNDVNLTNPLPNKVDISLVSPDAGQVGATVTNGLSLEGDRAINYLLTLDTIVHPKTLTCTWTDAASYVYTGQEIKPSISVDNITGIVSGEKLTETKTDGIYANYPIEFAKLEVSAVEGFDCKSVGDQKVEVKLVQGQHVNNVIGEGTYGDYIGLGYHPLNPANYVFDTTGTKEYTITKKPSTCTLTPISNLVYNGNAQTVFADTSVIDGGTVYVRIHKDSDPDTFVELKDFTLTDAGTCTIEYYLVGDSDHENIGSSTDIQTLATNVVISKLALTNATVTLGDALYFTGSEQSQTVSEVKVGDVVVSSDYYTITNNAATEKGDYTLTITANDNCNFSGSVTKAFKMNKALINPTVTITNDGWTFADQAVTPIVTGNTGNGTETFKYKVKDSEDSTYTTEVPTNAGTYVVKAIIAETDNYMGGEATCEFTIAPKAITENPFTVSGTYTYDKTAKTPTLTNDGGYTESDYDVVFGEGADHTSAGESVAFKVKFKGNYSGEFDMTFEIAKCAITVTPDSNQKKTYGADDPAFTYTVSPSLYTGDSLSNTLSRAAGETAGTYAITLGTLSNDNYDLTLNATPVNFTIEPKVLDNTAISISGTYAYTGSAITPTYEVKDGDITLVKGDDKDYTVAITNNTDANDASTDATAPTITITLRGNYSGTITKKFPIAKCTTNAISDLAIENWYAGETAATPSATSTFGTISYTYAEKDASIAKESLTYAGTVPTEAGEYWLKASVADNDNYNACDSYISFVIFSHPFEHEDGDITTGVLNKNDDVEEAKLDSISVDDAAIIVENIPVLSQALSDGKDVMMFVEVEEPSPAEEELFVEKGISSTNAVILNINLYGEVVGDATTKTQITDANGYKTKVSIALTPAQATSIGVSSNKNYFILRDHNNGTEHKIEEIRAQMTTDDNGNYVFTFETDKFSTYAIYSKNKPVYMAPKTGLDGNGYNNHSLLKLSCLTLFTVGMYMVVSRKKDNY